MSGTAIPAGKRGTDNLNNGDACHCLACGAEVLGPWCHVCGQKNDDCRRSIVRLAVESLSDVAALDGRFVRTCRSSLVKPGSHVHQYAHGKRSPFTPPVRFFLVVIFLFFSTLWITDRHLFVFQPILDAEDPGGVQINLGDVVLDPDADEEGAEDEDRGIWFHSGFLKPARDVNLTEEERLWLQERIAISADMEINGNGLSGERVTRGLIQSAENPAAFNNALNEWIPRLMVIFIPFMAVLGTLFIRGRDALVYDHLLLSLQVHAIAFLILTLSLWTSAVLPAVAAGWAFFLGVPLYYLLGLKGAFRRSWRKTIVAMIFVMSVYAFFFLIALLVAGIFSFFEIV